MHFLRTQGDKGTTLSPHPQNLNIRLEDSHITGLFVSNMHTAVH